MTLVNIDLRNQGYETGPDDRVIFYSLLVREGDFGTISTAPVEVELTDGQATVDLAPGPVGVQIIAGQVADTRVKIGEVPPSGPTTLNAVMMVTPAYTPALQKMMIAAIERAKEVAVGQVDGAVSIAIDAEVGEAIHTATSSAASAAASATSADTRATSAEIKVDAYTPRVEALEALGGLSPESPADGQTANLITQPETLTRTALNQAARQAALDAVKYISPSGLPDDQPAIQQEIDDLAAAGGGTLTLTPGTYKILATIEIPAAVCLRGSGQTSTLIDCTGLTSGDIGIHVMPRSVGAEISNLHLMGVRQSGTTGLHLGRIRPDVGDRQGTVDFVSRNVRIEDFDIGIDAFYAWCLRFENTRAHRCRIGIRLGSQANAIYFNGSITSFYENAAWLTNAEGVHFDLTNIDSNVVSPEYEGPAIRLFQSQVIMTQPYIENISRLATVGGLTEDPGASSAFITHGGRMSGTILLAGPKTQIDVTAPWTVATGTGTPLAVELAGGRFSYAPRLIRLDSMADPADGVKRIFIWDAKEPEWGIPNAYGGSSVTPVKHEDFYRVTSPSSAQGIRIAADLVVGSQYVLSYRARKTSDVVAMRVVDGTGWPISTSAGAADFATFHIPFIADGTAIRWLWDGDLDVQWISLTEGLNFLDRGQ